MRLFDRPRALPKRWEQLLSLLHGKPHIFSEYYVEEMHQAINASLASQHFDCVFFESSLIAGYQLPSSIPALIDQHNLEYEILLRTSQHEKAWLRRWYNRIEGQLLKPIEIERCRRARAIVVTSEREQMELQRFLPAQRIKVIPNGVDTETFHTHARYKEIDGRVVFTGALDYYPNMNAVLFFAQHCWLHIHERIPTATWHIVGKNPPAHIKKLEELPGVTITGSVPDVLPYLACAQVAIAPLLVGSGTRLKILEAFATQKAVVSTSVGSEGLEVEAGKHLVIADRPELFAREVIALLKDPERRRALGAAGRALVETRYSWQHCTQGLLQLLEEIQQEAITEQALLSSH